MADWHESQNTFKLLNLLQRWPIFRSRLFEDFKIPNVFKIELSAEVINMITKRIGKPSMFSPLSQQWQSLAEQKHLPEDLATYLFLHGIFNRMMLPVGVVLLVIMAVFIVLKVYLLVKSGSNEPELNEEVVQIA